MNAIERLRAAITDPEYFGDPEIEEQDLAAVDALYQAAKQDEWCEGCRHGHGCYRREEQGISCTGRLAAAVRRVEGMELAQCVCPTEPCPVHPLVEGQA